MYRSPLMYLVLSSIKSISVAWYRTLPLAGKPYLSLLVTSTVTHRLGYFFVISGTCTSWGFSIVLSIFTTPLYLGLVSPIFNLAFIIISFRTYATPSQTRQLRTGHSCIYTTYAHYAVYLIFFAIYFD